MLPVLLQSRAEGAPPLVARLLILLIKTSRSLVHVTTSRSPIPPTMSASKQSARARLRRDHLLSLEAQEGQECKVQLKEGREMDCRFRGMRSDGSLVLVSDLMTGLGPQPYAIIRSADVAYIKFEVQD